MSDVANRMAFWTIGNDMGQLIAMMWISYFVVFFLPVIGGVVAYWRLGSMIREERLRQETSQDRGESAVPPQTPRTAA